MTPISRRSLLLGTAAAGASVILPAGALGAWAWSSTSRSNAGRVRFGQRLHIPSLTEGTVDGAGRRVFDLRLRAGRTELLPGRTTSTWGVNGPYLGPTLRVHRGDVVAPVVHNDLPEATTVHWHGMELPAVADGGPHSLIAPGGVWSPHWTVDQPAATLWYHPHPHGSTKEHVYRGLAGLFYVEDGAAAGLLPQDYGVDDIPVVLQDKNFTEDGQLDTTGISYGGIDVVGLLGAEILVNGTWGPVQPVHTTRVRLRVLNASNSRTYDLVLHDGREFHVVAGDSGLLPAPALTDHVMVTPGERVELVVGLRPGEQVLLRSRPPQLRGDAFLGLLTDRLAGGADSFELLRLDAAEQLAPSPRVPGRLPARPALTVADARGGVRRMVLGDFTINGQVMDPRRVDAVVTAGATELWRIHNGQSVPHNFHIHNAAFWVLDIDGRAVPAWSAGPKDTVFTPPGRTVALAVAFGQHPDPQAAYMFHCHMLAHEDAGMMGQYVLVKPGTEDTVLLRPISSVPSTDGAPQHGHGH